MEIENNNTEKKPKLGSNIKNSELDFQNYSLKDMLKLFKISNNIGDDDIVQSRQKVLQLKNANVDSKLVSLFNKCNSIIHCVYKYRDYMKLTKPDYKYTEQDDNEFVRCVKLVPEFEKYNNVLDIVHSIVKNSITASNHPEEIKEKMHHQNNTNHGVVTSNPTNPIYSGDVNKIKRDTQIVNLHINSCFRENYYKTNPCDYKYSIPPQTNVVYLKLLSIELPNTWYLFSHKKKNNIFKIETTCKGRCSVHSVIIPDGNYCSESLVEYLNSKYFYNSTLDTPMKYLKFSIHPHTKKTMFEIMECAPDNFVYSLHFTDGNLDNIMETCGWILGFRLARYLKIDDVIFSEGLYDTERDYYVYLALNDYQYNYNESNVVCFDKMTINDSIIAKIPIRGGKHTTIVYENDKNSLIKIRRYNGPVDISKMEIKLLDKYGDPIEFNNMDWSFSLELGIMYENRIAV
jgi:hypothetical protein